MKGRKYTDQKRHSHGCKRREPKHAQIEADLSGERQRCAYEGNTDLDQQGGDADAGRGPEQTKQQCFGHELDDEPAATGTEGRANGHFLRSRHAAREQQVREIGTRDQQDEDDRAKCDVHRPAKIGTQVRIRKRIEGDRPAGVPFPLRRNVRKARVDGEHLLPRLTQADLWLQPSHDRQPMLARLELLGCERERLPETHRVSIEGTRGQHANDLMRYVVNGEVA